MYKQSDRCLKLPLRIDIEFPFFEVNLVVEKIHYFYCWKFFVNSK